MTEAQATTRILNYIREHKKDFLKSFAFEIKHTNDNRIYKSQIQEHQIDALVASKYGYVYKIRDEGISKKPFDGFFMKEVENYLIFSFRHHGFVFLPIHNFLKSSLKSFSFQEAMSLSFLFVPYPKVQKNNANT